MHNNNSTSTRPNARRLPFRHLWNSRLMAALSYPHGVDHYLQPIDPTWSVEEVRARVVGIRQQTPDTVTVRLQPNENWAGFVAGQYLRVAVDINGVRRTRCFSPANSIHDPSGEIELSCKIGPESVVSRHFAESASVGQVVHLAQAEGQFALPAPRPQRVLLISGGSGITPVMAMLRTLLDEHYTGRITFLHYANCAASQLYADELAAIAAAHDNVQLLRCYTQSEEGELGGLFSAEQLQTAVPDWAQAESFLCGPPLMMQAVEAAFNARSVSAQLHLERFSAAPLAATVEGSAEGEVRYAKSERVAPNAGTTLLEQAEAAGMSPECGCRMGICHSCTRRKLSGRVRDIRTGEVSEAGEEDVQICVCVPVGTVTMDL